MGAARKVSRTKSTKLGKLVKKVESFEKSSSKQTGQLAYHIAQDLQRLQERLNAQDVVISGMQRLMKEHLKLSDEDFKAAAEAHMSEILAKALETAKEKAPAGSYICEECVYVSEQQVDKCPKCSSENIFYKEQEDENVVLSNETSDGPELQPSA